MQLNLVILLKKKIYNDKCSEELKLFFEENPDFCRRYNRPLGDIPESFLMEPINNPIEEIEEEIIEEIEEEIIEEIEEEIEDEHTHLDLQIPTVAISLDDIIDDDITEF